MYFEMKNILKNNCYYTPKQLEFAKKTCFSGACFRTFFFFLLTNNINCIFIGMGKSSDGIQSSSHVASVIYIDLDFV